MRGGASGSWREDGVREASLVGLWELGGRSGSANETLFVLV